jgi:D-alanyl-D-alanine carboxypeptidase (penicillin-binding protein 5/6)
MKILVAAFAAVLSLSVFAQPLQAPEIAARAYLLVDVTANQILAQKDIDMPVEPASLTKLMTAYLVFDGLRTRKIGLRQARRWAEPMHCSSRAPSARASRSPRR